MTRKKKFVTATALLLGVAALAVLFRGALERATGFSSETNASELADKPAEMLDVSSQRPKEVRVSALGLETLRIRTTEVLPAPPPEPIRLTGSLLMDSNRLVRIHVRFAGSEIVSLGNVETDGPRNAKPEATPRVLQYGDKVKKGQILAVLWSKEIGEKKSELVDAISKMEIDQKLLARFEEVQKGAVPERTIFEAQRAYEADLIAVARAELTLRSWRLTEDEIEDIHQEAKRVQKRELLDPRGDRTWAETEVRAPIDGLIIEKNYNVGDIVDPAQDLFKIADLNQIEVLANAYEEDLPRLRALRPDQRIWRVDIKADPNDVPIEGRFDIVGNIIDPSQHAGAVMGSLDNKEGRLSIGEFITATIDLPADPTLVAVPTLSLVDDGNSKMVFVETDAAQHAFTCRKVAVTRQGREHSYVRAEPSPDERSRGAQPLERGERVVESGALELAAELKHLRTVAASH